MGLLDSVKGWVNFEGSFTDTREAHLSEQLWLDNASRFECTPIPYAQAAFLLLEGKDL